MPITSKQQWKWMAKKEPAMFNRWVKHTKKKYKDLPKKVQTEVFHTMERTGKEDALVSIYKNPTQTEWTRYLPKEGARGYVDQEGNLFIEGYEEPRQYGTLIHDDLIQLLNIEKPPYGKDWDYDELPPAEDMGMFVIVYNRDSFVVSISDSYTEAEWENYSNRWDELMWKLHLKLPYTHIGELDFARKIKNEEFSTMYKLGRTLFNDDPKRYLQIYKNPTPTEWRKYMPEHEPRGYIDPHGNLFMEGYEEKQRFGYAIHEDIMHALELSYDPYMHVDPDRFGIMVQESSMNKTLFLGEGYDGMEEELEEYRTEIIQLLKRMQKKNPDVHWYFDDIDSRKLKVKTEAHPSELASDFLDKKIQRRSYSNASKGKFKYRKDVRNINDEIYPEDDYYKTESVSDIDYKGISFAGGKQDRLFKFYAPYDLKDEIDFKDSYIAVSKEGTDDENIHIQIDESLQGKGLGAKVLEAFVYLYGEKVIRKARIVNDDLIKVLAKVNQHPKFTVVDEEDQYIILERTSFTESAKGVAGIEIDDGRQNSDDYGKMGTAPKDVIEYDDTEDIQRDFNSIGDGQHKKKSKYKFIFKEEFKTGAKFGEQYFEIYKNPTTDEVCEYARAVMTAEGDIYTVMPQQGDGVGFSNRDTIFHQDIIDMVRITYGENLKFLINIQRVGSTDAWKYAGIRGLTLDDIYHYKKVFEMSKVKNPRWDFDEASINYKGEETIKLYENAQTKAQKLMKKYKIPQEQAEWIARMIEGNKGFDMDEYDDVHQLTFDVANVPASKTQLKKAGKVLVFQNDVCKVYRIDNFWTAKSYGNRGTWCITGSEDTWDTYAERFVFYFVETNEENLSDKFKNAFLEFDIQEMKINKDYYDVAESEETKKDYYKNWYNLWCIGVQRDGEDWCLWNARDTIADDPDSLKEDSFVFWFINDLNIPEEVF